jgi:hypothetical protein
MSAFLFENKPERCPFGHELWPGKAQVSWKPCICEPAREAAERGRGMGHVRVACNEQPWIADLSDRPQRRPVRESMPSLSEFRYTIMVIVRYVLSLSPFMSPLVLSG